MADLESGGSPERGTTASGQVSSSPAAVGGRLLSRAPALSIAAIWLATLAAALLSPDLITGSQQEHLPLAAVLDWVWAAVATGYVAMVGRAVRGHGAGGSDAATFLVSMVAVWAAMAVASIFAPPLVTGTDPTQIPLVAILVPLIAMAATGFICLHAATTPRQP
jgi:hypothetical protein